jgi:hypothetical protein
MRSRAALTAIILGMLALLVIATPSLAAPNHQDDATPTPTATPGVYSAVVPLSSGNSAVLERTWTMGDLFVGFCILLVAAVNLLIWGAPIIQGLAAGKGRP